MTNIIEITEDRKIVCSLCRYEPSSQGVAPAWEIIEDIEKHYNITHKEVGSSLLRDNIVRLSPRIGDIIEIKKLMANDDWILKGKVVYIKDDTVVVDCGKHGIETLSTDDRLNFRTIIKTLSQSEKRLGTGHFKRCD